MRDALSKAKKGLQEQEEANLQHSKKNEELRVFYEYEIETYKKKLH